MIRLGNCKVTMPMCQDIPFIWPSDYFTYLGIKIPLNGTLSFHDLNFKSKFEEIKTTLNIWNRRSLTLYGKVTIIKSLVIPKLIYLLCILPDPPLSFFSELQRVLFKFVWSNKKDKIRRSLLYNEYKEGGLKMPLLLSFNRAMKVTWIKRYFDEENKSKWKMFFAHSLRRMGVDIFFSGNLRSDHLMFNKYADPFWNDILTAWSHYKYYNPVKFKDIISQPLCLNSHILVGGKPLNINIRFNSDMTYVKDILRIDGSFMSFDQIQRQMKFLSGSFMLYYSVLSALPSSWKRILKQGNFEMENASLNCVDNLLNEFRKPKKISKLTYNIFLNKFSANISETNQQDKWQRDLQNNLNDSLIWKSRFTLIYRSSIDNKMRNFQFKLIHRKIATQSFLYKIGISTSSLCTFCENHEQTLSRLFVNCEKVRSFWNVICAWLKEKNIRK